MQSIITQPNDTRFHRGCCQCSLHGVHFDGDAAIDNNNAATTFPQLMTLSTIAPQKPHLAACQHDYSAAGALGTSGVKDTAW